MAILPVELAIVTINVWGIPLVSSDRDVRISAIAKELCSGRYDIVSMQEVWSQKDVETLKESTKAVLPYSHYFFSGVIGAGLLVLSKYPIVSTLFHAWSVNGYFHRIQHADWFGGKGVGLCKILVNDQVIHVYNAHLHAEYDNENDEYKTHRVIQAFDTAQFIEATRADSVVQILAGDLNTQPHDICYKILLVTSRMLDCCTSNCIATNECHRNSYTPRRLLDKNPEGIRIDHIFMRSADHIEASVLDYFLPFPERVPGQKFSFSDHEAVMAQIRLQPRALTQTQTIPTLAPADQAECGPRDRRRVSGAACSINGNNVHSKMANGLSGHLHHTPPVFANHCDECIDEVCLHSVASDANTKFDNNLARNRIAVLNEAIALCDASFEQLTMDRILYYSTVVCSIILLIVLAEFPTPSGFKAIFLILKLVIFGIIIFSLFMGSIWNFMEHNGILSGKKSMEVLLRNAEKYELSLK